jgi:hypothetical protein
MAPRELERLVYEPQTNESILNGIRKTASDDYRKRVPRAVQADIQTSMRRLAENTPTWNEFVRALVNQIGAIDYKNKVWSNPLAEFKGPMLSYGDTIEEVATGLIQSYVYDPDHLYMERMLFGQHRPDAISSFHKINREVFFPITINKTILQRAFTSEYGLSDFITGLMDAPATSDQWDEFLTMANLLKEYDRNGGFFREHINDVADAGSTETTVKGVLRTMRAYAKKLPFISTLYNPAGVPSFANASDMILIATPDFAAALDVEALASLFNVQYAEVPYRVVMMPEQYMPNDVQAILTTKDFFVVRDTFFDTTSQENAVGLTENFYLHHHGIYSVSRFVPAIAFTTGEGTVIELEGAPVTGVSALTLTDEDGDTVTVLTRGRNHIASALATTAGVNDAVSYSITGNLSTKTRIGQTGTLYVDEEERATTIVVRWTAVDAENEAYTNTSTFNVVGGKFTQWPNPGYNPDADTDGLLEVTPKALTVDDNDDVTIPSVEGVQYNRAGVDVPNGSVQHITASTVFIAAAKAGYELKSGATASWTLAP